MVTVEAEPGEETIQSYSAKHLRAGDLAYVIPNRGGASNVRKQPRLGPNVKDQTPELAVLAILPKPGSWTGEYPVDDRRHVWWYARGRTEERHADGRFKIVEGWIAASQNGTDFLERLGQSLACLDTMGTSHDSPLVQELRAYVLPGDGLNVRKGPGQHADIVRTLSAGTVVTGTGRPECKAKMVWRRVRPLNSADPIGWVSQRDTLGEALEWLLLPVASSV